MTADSDEQNRTEAHEEQEPDHAETELAAASAAIDELLADLPEEQAREILELALTEVVMKADPEAEEPL